MEDLISQSTNHTDSHSSSRAQENSMPWLTRSADKRITDDPSLAELGKFDRDDEETPPHRITRVRHHKILKRVRQKIQKY